MDSDDLWDETKLAKQVSCLESHSDVGLVHTWMALTDAEGNPTGRIMRTAAKGNVWEQLIEKNLVACSSVMARRDCFTSVGLLIQI